MSNRVFFVENDRSLQDSNIEMKIAFEQMENEFKGLMMEKFRALQLELRNKEKEANAELKSLKNEKLDEFETNNEDLEEKILIRDRLVDKYVYMNNNLALQIWKVNRREKRKQKMRSVLIAWKSHVEEKKKQRKMKRIANAFFEKKMKMKIFRALFVTMYRNRIRNYSKGMNSKLKSKLLRFQNDFEQEIRRIDNQIALSHQMVMKERGNKEALQEKLKKALMKGVFSMNTQFLSIIKDTKQGNDDSEEIGEFEEEEEDPRIMKTRILEKQLDDILEEQKQRTKNNYSKRNNFVNHFQEKQKRFSPQSFVNSRQSVPNRFTKIDTFNDNPFQVPNAEEEEDSEEEYVEEARKVQPKPTSYENSFLNSMKQNYTFRKLRKPNVKVSVIREKRTRSEIGNEIRREKPKNQKKQRRLYSSKKEQKVFVGIDKTDRSKRMKAKKKKKRIVVKKPQKWINY